MYVLYMYKIDETKSTYVYVHIFIELISENSTISQKYAEYIRFYPNQIDFSINQLIKNTFTVSEIISKLHNRAMTTIYG